MYVNFKKIKIVDINGQQQEADFSQQLGNQLYMNGQNIEECELGKKLYFADGEIELDEKEVDIVLQFTQTLYSYIIRTALTDILKG
jgi:hypothetical protein